MNLLGHPFLSSFWLVQFLDIALVTYLVWLLLRAIWRQPAMKAVSAVVLVWVLSVLLNAMGFYSIGLITSKLAPVIFFALIVIFSQEVKDILSRFGRYLSRIGFLNLRHQGGESEAKQTVDAVADTCSYLQEKGFGGLMVITRFDKDITTYCSDQFNIESLEVHPAFIKSFLTPPAPCHDGAVVISDGKIIMVRAILPLTFPGKETADLGTRHRAAKGLSERTDAVVVVVSEETGKIRLAHDGKLEPPTVLKGLKDKLLPLIET